MPSETFVVHEILGLVELGIDIKVVALAKPSEEQICQLDDSMKAVISGVRYLRRVPIPASFGALVDLIRMSLTLGGVYGIQRWWRPSALVELLRVLAVSDLAKYEDVDLVYTHWPSATRIGVLAAKIARIPVGVSIHAHEVAHDNKHFKDVFCWIQFAAFCNNAARNYLADVLGKIVYEKSNLIYHGVDTDRFAPASIPAVKGHLIIVTAGRLTSTKGMDRLIESIRVAKDQGVPVKLKIIGEGGERVALENQVRENSLSNEVEFLGWIHHDQIGNELASGHVFALFADDSFHDGLPNVVFEALALGRPAILTPIPASREVVVHGENGFILDSLYDYDGFVQHCRNLISTEGLLASLSEGAVQTANRYSKKDQLQDLRELFKTHKKQ